MRLFLFGPPRLETDAGSPISLDTRKALALAAYLVVSGASHSRDSLATLLWPESDNARARGALRRTLSTLKKALGGRWLEIEGDTVALRPDDELQIDVALFQAALAECRTHGHPPDQTCPHCASALRQAVAIYTADFLAGFSLKYSVEFDDWQFFQAESLRRQVLSVLDRLIQWESDQQNWNAAIEHAKRRLSADMLHEPAHAQLMRLYALAGERGAALRQYRTCVHILDEELGVPPLAETIEMYESIRANQLMAPAVVERAVDAERMADDSGHVPAADGLSAAREHDLSAESQVLIPALSYSRLPLVGRQNEWQMIQSIWQAGHSGSLIAISGEAGIGKTRLIDELMSHARAQGAVTAMARCFPHESELAYGPLLEVLRPLLADDVGRAVMGGMRDWQQGELARLLPDMLPGALANLSAPPLSSPGGQTRFFQALSDLLAARFSGPVPGVLAFDDLQWADSATLEFLSWCVHRLATLRLCLVLAWRSGEGSQEQQINQFVHIARRDGQVVEIALERLSFQDVMELLERLSPTGQDTIEFARQLYGETEGTPFFLAEQLAQTTTNLSGGQVRLARHTILDLFSARLQSLDDVSAQVLSAGAVIGRSFDLETVQAASGRSEEEAVLGIEVLLQRRLVVEQAGESTSSPPRYDFCHERLRELVYEETSLARRRLLHRRVAESLARWADRRAGAAAQTAFHFQKAGQDTEAAQHYSLAAGEAQRLFAYPEALNNYRAALALGHPYPGRLQAAIGQILTLQGSYARAIIAFEQAAAYASAGDELAEIEGRIGQVYQRMGDWELAAEHFRAGLAEPELNDGVRARLLAGLSHSSLYTSGNAAAQVVAESARTAAEAAGDPLALADVLNLCGLLARARQDLAQARHFLTTCLDQVAQLGEPAVEIAARNNLALVLAEGGDHKQAEDQFSAALALCVRWGDRHHAAALHNNLADLYHGLGQEERSMDHLKQAVTLFAEVGASEAEERNPEIWKLVSW